MNIDSSSSITMPNGDIALRFWDSKTGKGYILTGTIGTQAKPGRKLEETEMINNDCTDWLDARKGAIFRNAV